MIVGARVISKKTDWQEKGQIRHQLSPPWALDDNDFAVDAAQAAVGGAQPTTRPSDASLPLSGHPEQDAHDTARDESNLFRHVDQPVYAAADATIFPRAEELAIEEVGDPEKKHYEDESVLSAART
jgi:hypothetical protein